MELYSGPTEMSDFGDDDVFAAIMQGAALRRFCPSRPRRKTVITAVKSFWRSVYARRQIQNWNERNERGDSLKYEKVYEFTNGKVKEHLGDIDYFLKRKQATDIKTWEGKFKLSQDKLPKDKENARQQLIKSSQDSIKAFLDKVFKN